MCSSGLISERATQGSVWTPLSINKHTSVYEYLIDSLTQSRIIYLESSHARMVDGVNTGTCYWFDFQWFFVIVCSYTDTGPSWWQSIYSKPEDKLIQIFWKKISFIPSPLSYQTHGNLLPDLVWWPVDTKGASISRVLCLGTAGRNWSWKHLLPVVRRVPWGSPGFWLQLSLFAGWARLSLQLPLAATHNGSGSFSATLTLPDGKLIRYPAVK